MALDDFRRVLFNGGEQVTAGDVNALQRQIHMLLMEMFVYPKMGNIGGDPDDAIGAQYDPEGGLGAQGHDGTTIPTDVALCPFPSMAFVAPSSVTARRLGLGIPGPLVQVNDNVSGNPTESTECVMMYWLENSEFTLDTDVGDANPRVDLVQMKLEYVSTSPETRVTSINAVQASRDLAPLTSSCETVIRARVGGKGGNNITIAFVADGAGVGSLTANGNALTFHYQSGVTTVANFETAVAASDLIEVQTTDGVGTLTAPGDTFAATALTGGVNRLILSGNPNKAKRVQATFSIKKGTAGVTPTYPTPDAGYCAVAAVYIPALHNAVHSVDNIRDVRIPLGGLEVVDVMFHQMNEQGGGTSWTVEKGNNRIVSGGGAGYAYAHCPIGGNCGRVIAVAAFGRKGGGNNAVKLKKMTYTNGVNAPTYTSIADLESTIGDTMDAANAQFAIADMNDFADESMITDGQRPLGVSSRLGTPFWTNGEPYGPLAGSSQIFDGVTTFKKLAVEFEAGGSGDQVSWVRFYIAKGMK